MRFLHNANLTIVVKMSPPCIVGYCNNRGTHVLPSDETRRAQWIQAIKHIQPGLTVRKHSRICSSHFKATDFSRTPLSLLQSDVVPKTLKKTAVPSVFSWNKAFQQNPSTSQDQESPSTSRDQDLLTFDVTKLRATYAHTPPVMFVAEQPFLNTMSSEITEDPLSLGIENTDQNYFVESGPNSDMGENYDMEVDVAEELEIPFHADLMFQERLLGIPEKLEKSVQTNDASIIGFSIYHYRNNDKAMHFYTGLENFNKVMLVFNTLGECAHKLNYFYGPPPSKLDALEQFFITLLILRRHKPFEEIAMMYQVTMKQIYNIFITWIRFMSLQWKNVDLWVDRENVKAYMPLDFHDKYPSTRVVLDATECPIKKPKLPFAQQVTFSSYKNRNTVKFLIGITPSGLISYVSSCYGGSATDRQIIERSSILSRFDYNDEIMVDKGLNVQDIFVPYGVKGGMHILCTICSDLVNQAENIYATKCGHIFHYQCLAKWITRSKSCPQCRNKVTEICMFRIYPTISNEQSGQDVATLQSRLDDAHLQLREQRVSIKEAEDKLASLALELKKHEEKLKATEKKLISRDSAVSALKEQLEYVKEQNKVTEKLREENETLKKNLQTLNGLQKVLNATSEEVEQMLESYSDLRTVATFATALKRALCDSEAKKNESRDRLVETKQKLALEKKNCADLQAKNMQLLENQSSIVRKYKALKNKRKASELSGSNFFDDSSEPAIKVHRPDAKQQFNDAILTPTDSNSNFNQMLVRIKNAESPYLNLKQNSLALAALQKPATIVGDGKLKPSEFAMLNSARSAAVKKLGTERKPSNNQQKDVSIFNKKEPAKMDFIEEKELNLDVDISYDGLGGHSKLEKFPVSSTSSTTWKPKNSIPKLTTKHKLKRPTPPTSQDIGKMLEKIRDK